MFLMQFIRIMKKIFSIIFFNDFKINFITKNQLIWFNLVYYWYSGIFSKNEPKNYNK